MLNVYSDCSVRVPVSSFVDANLPFFSHAAKFTADPFETTNSNTAISKGSTAVTTEELSPTMGILLQLFTSRCVCVIYFCDLMLL